MGNELLDRAFALVQQLGRPLAVAAWATVFLAAIGLGALLRRRDLSGSWPASLAVGGVGLVAHLADYVITLKVPPLTVTVPEPVKVSQVWMPTWTFQVPSTPTEEPPPAPPEPLEPPAP